MAIVITSGDSMRCVGAEALESSGNKLPWPGCDTETVSQGNAQGPSHEPGSSMEYAIDFALAEGARVSAVRSGRVSHVQDGKSRCGGPGLASEGNYVVVDHGDGTSALYLHLQRASVTRGQDVRQGQEVGLSGKTGWTYCVPHLHFQLQQSGPIWFSQSIPMTFDDAPGAKFVRFEDLHSENYTTELVESFFYDPYYALATSATTLHQGSTYTIIITGTFSWWSPTMWGTWTGSGPANLCEGTPEQSPMFQSPGRANGPASSDAEYLYAYPKYHWYGVYTCKTGALRLGRSSSVLMSVDGGRSFAHITPVDGRSNQSHVYQYHLVGRGYPLQVKIEDVLYTDNNGMLRIDIEVEE